MAAQSSAPNAPPVDKPQGLASFAADGLAEKIEDLWNSFAKIKYGRKDPASRTFTFGSQFAIGTMAINAAQFLGAPLALINEDWHNDWIKFNKQQWGLLITTMTSWWSPTLVRVSGDKSVRGQISKSADGQLVCNFAERMVLIANHQIYTDWLYLWYIGYANGLHGQIHVVMKESLKKLPLVGWGMTLSKFIFLKRNWEQDKAGLAKHLETLNKPPDEPMWLMFFPEGTNLAPSTREKSKSWADKNGIEDMRHVLLPRSTGLQFSLLKLRETVDYVYDCTIAYEGVPRGEYAQDIFTLQTAWVGGHPPKSVNMYWRRFKMSTIPLDDLKKFDLWLRARWAEKDTLIEYYMRTGRFPADEGFDNLGVGGETRQGAGHIETQVKPNNWYEILQVFAPIATIAIVLYYFYNQAIPTQFMGKASEWAGYSEEDIKKILRVGGAPKLGKPKSISVQALKNTLKPPKLDQSPAPSVKSAGTSVLPRKSSIQVPTAHSKPASTYAGSVVSRAKEKPSTVTASTPKVATKTASSQSPIKQAKPITKLAGKTPAVAPQKPKDPSNEAINKETASKNPSTIKPQLKTSPAQERPPKLNTSTKNATAKSTPKVAPKKAPSSNVSAAKTNTKTTSSKDLASDGLSSKANLKAPAKTDEGTTISTKKPKATTKANEAPTKSGAGTATRVQKPKSEPAAPAISKQSKPTTKSQVDTIPKSAKPTEKPPQTSPSKPSNVRKTPATTTAKKTSETKSQLAPTSKAPIDKVTTKKTPSSAKAAPRQPSVQAKQGAWSDTTAVDDPWSERPSGKRLLKAQPTRKDRVKMEKKQQRRHLDHI